MLEFCQQSKLNPSTLSLFFHYFDIYMSNFSEATLVDYGSKIIPIAITCFRLAAKFNENQEDLWKDKVVQKMENGAKRQVCSHQLIYDTLTSFLLKTKIVDQPRNEQEVSGSVEEIKNYIFQSEMQVLQTLDFQPMVANGFDILNLILKIANPTFNFDFYIKQVQDICMEHLFAGKLPMFKQSVLYLAVLKQVLIQNNCIDFFNELKNYIQGERIVDSFDEVDRCFEELQAAA